MCLCCRGVGVGKGVGDARGFHLCCGVEGEKVGFFAGWVIGSGGGGRGSVYGGGFGEAGIV